MDMKGFFAFEGLTDFERMTFVSACKNVELPEDEAIVTQGERMDGLYFVTDGGLRVHVEAGAMEQELALMAAPCLVGELELFVDAPVAATVTTIERVSALVMPYAAFRQRLADNDLATYKIVLNLAGLLANRLHAADRRVGEISRHTS